MNQTKLMTGFTLIFTLFNPIPMRSAVFAALAGSVLLAGPLMAQDFQCHPDCVRDPSNPIFDYVEEGVACLRRDREWQRQQHIQDIADKYPQLFDIVPAPPLLSTNPMDSWLNRDSWPVDMLAKYQNMNCYLTGQEQYDHTGTLHERLAQTVAVWYRFAYDRDEYHDWVCSRGWPTKPNFATLPQIYEARPGPSPRWETLEKGGSFIWDTELDSRGVNNYILKGWDTTLPVLTVRPPATPPDVSPLGKYVSGINSQDWRFWPYACQEVMSREIEMFLHLQCEIMDIAKSKQEKFARDMMDALSSMVERFQF